MNDNDIERRAREALDESVERLPGEIRSRLATARQEALAANRTRGRDPLSNWLIPASGFAVALLVLALWQPLPKTVEVRGSLATLDLELLLSTEGPELLDELDFLLWLEAESRAG